MQEGSLQYLAQVLRGLTAGVDPATLLDDALHGAVAAGRGRNGMILGLVEGTPTVVSSTGTTPRVVLDAGNAAVLEGRMVRRRDQISGAGAVAEPVRSGNRVVGAVSVGGDPVTLDGAPLPVFADAASLILARRPAASGASVAEFSEALVQVGRDLDLAGVLLRMFDAAERLFAARGGFVVVPDGEGWKVAQTRGIGAPELREASKNPHFQSFVASPSLRVEPPSSPVVAALVRGAETAVSVPLVAGGKRFGFLVLLLGEAPEPAAQGLISAFASQIGLALRGVEHAQLLRDHEQRLASVVHCTPNPIMVVDDQGRFVLVNGAAGELFHLAEAFAVGQPVTGRLGHEGLETLLTASDDGQIEVLLGSPPDRMYQAASRRIRSAGGRDLGRVLVLVDVTKERETDRIKNDFVSVIGHELRTPLTVVKGYVKMLGRKGGEIGEDARRTAVAALESNTNRLERLIDDLLFVSSIDSSTPTLDLENTDIGAVLTAMAGDRVIVRNPSAKALVTVDRAKLDQVLGHLLDNAVKYTEGDVILSVSDRGDAVEIGVEDNGPGIFSGDVPQLFERFRQLDGTSTRNQGGTGLGLYICRRLVDLMGGRIWCESRLGVGSRFAFTLPKDGPLAPPVAEPAPPARDALSA
jgi:signal transduction histidine kinase